MPGQDRGPPRLVELNRSSCCCTTVAARRTTSGVADGSDQAPHPLPGDDRPAGAPALHRHRHVLPRPAHRVARRHRYRRHRRALRRRRDQPHRRPPRAARGARPVLAAAPPAPQRRRSVRHRARARPGRLLDRAALHPGRLARRDRRLLRHGRRGQGRAAVGRRRPLDQPADPARGRRAAPRRHGPHRRPLRHRRRLPRLALPSRRAVPPRRRRGPARPATASSRSASAAPPTIPDMWGFSTALRHARAADGGVPRQGLALRRRGGAARCRATARPT